MDDLGGKPPIFRKRPYRLYANLRLQHKSKAFATSKQVEKVEGQTWMSFVCPPTNSTLSLL